MYHISITAAGIRLGAGIAHTSGYVAIVLFLEVVALSRKLRYALLCCGVPVNQAKSPSALMSVEGAWFV